MDSRQDGSAAGSSWHGTTGTSPGERQLSVLGRQVAVWPGAFVDPVPWPQGSEPVNWVSGGGWPTSEDDTAGHLQHDVGGVFPPQDVEGSKGQLPGCGELQLSSENIRPDQGCGYGSCYMGLFIRHDDQASRPLCETTNECKASSSQSLLRERAKGEEASDPYTCYRREHQPGHLEGCSEDKGDEDRGRRRYYTCSEKRSRSCTDAVDREPHTGDGTSTTDVESEETERGGGYTGSESLIGRPRRRLKPELVLVRHMDTEELEWLTYEDNELLNNLLRGLEE